MEGILAGIFIAGTADTKFEEIAFLGSLLAASDLPVITIDLSTRPHDHQMDVSAQAVAGHHPEGAAAVLGGDDRGAAVSAMALAMENYCLAETGNITALIGVGGGGGTSMITAGMRQLPYGVPKMMVSTLASGDVSPFVDISDIIMFPSVTDIAGLNRLSRTILNNAAQAVLGMTSSPWREKDGGKPPIGLSMFGVTTPAVTAAADELRSRFDCLVFHATGTGGRAMEKLLQDGMLTGLVDLTTTEIADFIVGGVLSAGPGRLDAVTESGLPYVGSVGALDMVNFWAPGTMPEKFSGRLIHRHNADVTLMRTTADECRLIGEWIGNKLNACTGPMRFLLPEAGISALDIKGGAFFDPAADEALFEAIAATMKTGGNRQLIRLPFHINDPEFASAAVRNFLEIMET